MILYKYRDWNNDYHKRVLLFRELFFAVPSSFNDPYDCKIPIDYRVLRDDAELERIFCQSMVERDFPDFSEDEKRQKFNDLLERRPWGTDEGIKEYTQKLYGAIKDKFGVLCLTANKKDDIIIWSHYANSHTGFCIGFHEFKLLERIKQTVGTDFIFGPVDYLPSMPTVLPTADKEASAITMIKTKSQSWIYENEYRMISIQLNNRTIQFLPEEVAEIIIGCATPKAEAELILKVCKLNFPNIPIYKAKQSPYEFKLEFEQIG